MTSNKGVLVEHERVQEIPGGGGGGGGGGGRDLHVYFIPVCMWLTYLVL